MTDTNKYTRNFRDFGAYPWAGKNMPEYYDYLENGGDGNPGLQYMIQHAMAMYGPYHVVEGCVVTTTSDQITGSVGFIMWSGGISEVTSEGRTTLSDGDWFIINQGGTYGTTGDKPTGVIIGRRVGSNIWDMRDRYDENSNRYFPNSVNYYAQIKTYNDITGNLDNISGYESISANTGIFGDIKGFSDIGMQDSLDFKDTYHLKGVSQITGSIISGSQITGTSGNINNFTSLKGNFTDLTSLKGNFTALTGDSVKLGETDFSNNIIKNIENQYIPPFYSYGYIFEKDEKGYSMTASGTVGHMVYNFIAPETRSDWNVIACFSCSTLFDFRVNLSVGVMSSGDVFNTGNQIDKAPIQLGVETAYEVYYQPLTTGVFTASKNDLIHIRMDRYIADGGIFSFHGVYLDH